METAAFEVIVFAVLAAEGGVGVTETSIGPVLVSYAKHVIMELTPNTEEDIPLQPQRTSLPGWDPMLP